MKQWSMLLILLLSASVYAQQRDLSDWMDAFVRKLPPDRQFQGNILIERNGQTILEKSYGLAVEGWKIPNTAQTRFEIASVSKQFTAVAILQLAEQGKLSLDDPIGKYYKNAPESWKAITIHELLTHTSGIPNNDIKDYLKGIAAPYTLDELIQTFRDRPLAFPPGTKWAYTNTEYYLLAYIIKELSGEDYGAYLTHHIFEPLKMTHSGFASTLAIIPNAAEGYTFEDGRLRHRDYFDQSLEIGAGGIYTTVEDLVLWNNALDSPGFLTSHSLDLMFTAHPPGHYGYGWFVDSAPRRRIYHEGGDPGFAAFEARYPDQQLLIVVLSNIENAPVRDAADTMAEYILNGTSGKDEHSH
jgi:CubicO group peptidase (beta-lactamase class C family)